MNGLVDYLVVGSLVSVSALYAAAALGPRPLRAAILRGLARAAALLSRSHRASRLSERLAAAAAKNAGSCGACDNCASGVKPAATESAPEIRVPLGEIRRRT